MPGTFRSLSGFNYRLWAAGALVSNVGTWMQRTAQDWLVLTQLTHKNATAVGVVMALQFGPQVLFLPWTGFAADHLDRRKLLFATQAGSRPPHFVLFTTGFLQAGYRRFIERRLREEFGFQGSPVHLSMRLRQKRSGSAGRQARGGRRTP